MIDAGKLLGGLLNGSLSSGNLMGSGRSILPGKAAVGMGLLGVAIAAFEHFSEQGAGSSRNPPPPVAPRPAGNAPPPPPPGVSRTAPPNPPSGGGIAPTPPPPAGSAAQSANQVDPILLIRAMIASANADGSIDAMERERIMTRFDGAGLTGEEREFLLKEMDAPRAAGEIVAATGSPASAAQVYAGSLLAVEVDTEAEKDYLENLRQALGLDPASAEAIARSIGR
jgi:uncharacterized membrane protein YebE (DUF533 family)